jgi:hypothetical protein
LKGPPKAEPEEEKVQGEVAQLFSVSGVIIGNEKRRYLPHRAPEMAGFAMGNMSKVASRLKIKGVAVEVRRQLDPRQWRQYESREQRCGGLPVLQTRRTFGVPVGRRVTV